jgi:hypothetical protein
MEIWLNKEAYLILAAVMVVMSATTWQAMASSRLPSRQAVLAQGNKQPVGQITGSPSLPEELATKLTSDERAALTRPDDPGGRVKTYSRLAHARLKAARDLLTQDQYQATQDQLEIYTALVEDAGRFLAASVPPRNRANKTIEQELREQIRVLEGVRRDLPAAYVEIAEKALAVANRVRLQALNAFLGDGKSILLKDQTGKSKKVPEEQF